MSDKSLLQKMEPVLRRPGMYVGENPVRLLWYLSGMIDLETVFSRKPAWFGSLHLELAERLGISDDLDAHERYSAVEAMLAQGDPSDQIAMICHVSRSIVTRLENSQ